MMNWKNFEFLLVGVDSEYVLSPFAFFLQENNFSFFELDFGKHKLDDFLNFHDPKKEIIFVSSAHPLIDLSFAKIYLPLFYKNYPNYVGTLELIKILHPKITCYVPHDLGSLLNHDHMQEWNYLFLFDIFCHPFIEMSIYHGYSNIINTGWIKYILPSNHDDISPTFQSRDRCLFISMLEHLRWRFGEMGVFEYFKPLLTENTSVKFPQWIGVSKLEDIFRNNSPAQIIASNENSIDVISAHKNIITNGLSSIITESILMGKNVYVLASPEGIGDYDTHLKMLEKFKDINIVDYQNPVELFIDNLSISKKPVILKPFDFELLIQTIEKNLHKRKIT